MVSKRPERRRAGSGLRPQNPHVLRAPAAPLAPQSGRGGACRPRGGSGQLVLHVPCEALLARGHCEGAPRTRRPARERQKQQFLSGESPCLRRKPATRGLGRDRACAHHTGTWKPSTQWSGSDGHRCPRGQHHPRPTPGPFPSMGTRGHPPQGIVKQFARSRCSVWFSK